MSKIISTPVFLSLLAVQTVSGLVQAQVSETEDKKSEKVLDTVTVQANAINASSEETQEYKIDASDSAARFKMPVKETPNTINTVTSQQMKDFGLKNARDVLAASPGVVVQRQETERTSYSSRGSEISNFQVDGLGFPFSDYNYQSGDIDTSIYDRIEVLKGANGLTSSLGDPGATVNFIRKRPTKDLHLGAGLSYGSWDTARAEADISGSFTDSKKYRYRLVGATQKGNSYLDHYSLKKSIVSGVIEADLTDSTTLTIGHFTQANRPEGNNWGALPLLDQAGKQLHYDRTYNPNPDWASWERTTKNSFAELRQRIGADWELKATYQFVKEDDDSNLVYYMGAPDAAGNGVSIFSSHYTTDDSQKLLDVSLSGSFDLFGRKHEAVIGTNWMKLESRQRSYGADAVPVINWYNNWDGQFTRPTFTYADGIFNGGDYNQEISAIYAATRLHVADDWKLLLGVNSAKSIGSGYSYGVRQDYDKTRALPYAGLTYNFLPEYTAYTSYSTIYRPETGLDAQGNQLQPVEGRAYEVGVKGSWFENRLSGSLALFQSDQNHYPLRASDSIGIIKLYQVGRLKTQGYELNLAGRIATGTDLSFGWTHTRMRDAKANEETRTYLPSRIANVSINHQLAALPAARIGASVLAQSKTWQDIESAVYGAGDPIPYSGRIRQGEYALLDLMTSYDLTDSTTVQANFRNVTNKKYLNSFPDGQGYYGAPANYTVSVSYTK